MLKDQLTKEQWSRLQNLFVTTRHYYNNKYPIVDNAAETTAEIMTGFLDLAIKIIRIVTK